MLLTIIGFEIHCAQDVVPPSIESGSKIIVFEIGIEGGGSESRRRRGDLQMFVFSRRDEENRLSGSQMDRKG